jgi:hypothetical protein
MPILQRNIAACIIGSILEAGDSMFLLSDGAFLQATNYHNPGDSIFYSHYSEIFKSHIVDVKE